MIVRELLARFGIKTDKASFTKADQRVEKTKQALSSLAGYFSVTIAAIGFKKVVELASDVNETLNVLQASFGANEQSVKDWAKGFGDAAGRSQFAMREMAGELGAILNPLMEQNQDIAAEMSTNLAALAVDLGSFYNATDDEALTALRSGIVGETEPLKKFGVVMLEANLAAYAMEKGITKNIKSMSIAEKTQLRYNFLLDKTKLAQGDAAKTSDGYANATKGLFGGFRDLVTIIGQKFLPVVEWIVRGGRSVVRTMAEWAEKSNIVEAAILVLSAAAIAAAAPVIAAWLPVILPFLKIAAVVGAVILVVDDFLTFLEGGDSVIGKFIDSLFGPGSATEAARFLRDGIEMLSNYFKDTFLPALKQFPQAVKLLFNDIKKYIKDGLDEIAAFFDNINAKIKEFTGLDIKAFVSMGVDLQKNIFGRALNPLGAITDDLKEMVGLSGETFEATKEVIKARHRQARVAEATVRVKAPSKTETRNTNNKIEQNNTFNLVGGDKKQQKGTVDKIRRLLDDTNKKTLKALRQTNG